MDFQYQMKTEIVEDLLLNCENEETGPVQVNTGKSSRGFGEEVIKETIAIKIEDQGVDYAYGLHIEDHFVEPEFVVPEELAIKAEDQEVVHRNTEEFQNKVNFPLNTYIKSELITSEIEVEKPLYHQQTSEASEDPIKEECFAETEFLIPEVVDIKCEDEESGQLNMKSTGDEPPVFKCFNCSYQTHRKGNIYHHVRRHMEMTFKCPQCPFKTWKSSYLMRHNRVHAPKDEVYWYQCRECTFKTKLKKDLTQKHMLIHRKNLPMHKCPLCSHESPRVQTLANHLKKVHKPKDCELVSCPEPGCSFKTHDESNVARHSKRVHKRK